MSNENKIKGKLVVALNVYEKIVHKSVDTCYGIVGTSTPRGVTFFSYLLPSLFDKEGVSVCKGKNGLIIDVYVIVEYGINIRVISQNLCDNIRFQIKEFCNTDIETINVHVKGIRKSRY